MKVILTTTIKKLGKMGDKVSVKPGYARNFLFPNKMALRENKKNAEYYEKIKDEIKKNEEKKLVEAMKKGYQMIIKGTPNYIHKMTM